MTDARMTPAGRKAAENANRGTHYVGADKSDEDIAKAGDVAKLTDTTKLNAKPRAGFPARKDFGSQDEYLAAIKKYNAQAAGQRDALKK